MTSSPVVSVVLITPDDYARIARTVDCLERQTIHHELELVVVAPSRQGLDELGEHRAAFASLKIVEAGEFRSVGALKVAGIRASNAEILAFAEDHSFPDRDWAEQLVAAWERYRPGAVGAVMSNANPGTVSWVDMLLCFGPFVETRTGGVVDGLPWHNTSYRREDLMAFGSDLARLMSMEFLIQEALQSMGKSLRLVPEVRTLHVNASDLQSAIRATFWGNRMYGSYRAASESWGYVRRALYSAAWPAIASWRCSRAIREWRRLEVRPRLAGRLGIALLLGASLAAAGEVAGYVTGCGSCERHRLWAELHRAEMVRPSERVLFEVKRA